ncbi:MAG: hypothetical protein ACR2HK_14900 [Gemmatimonadales bacterium]
MTEAPSHEELHEMLPAAAWEVLDGEDLQLVLAHARDCAACARLLGEYREVAAAIALVLPHRQLSAAGSAPLRARLLARARESGRPAPVRPEEAATGSPARRRFSLAERWAGWAVAAGLAGVMLMHHAVHRPLDYGWLVAGALLVVLIGLGAYARDQRGRASALQSHLDSLQRRSEPFGP